MLTFSLFLLLSIFIIKTSTSSMILFWGQPVFLKDPNYSVSWEDCPDKCHFDPRCAMITKEENDQCNIYYSESVNYIMKSTKYNGMVVGVKRTMEDTECPVNLEPPLFGETEVMELGYTITRTVTSENVAFYFNTIKCPSDSKRYIRGSNVACIQTLIFATNNFGVTCKNYTEADNSCRSLSDGSMMTGPYDKDEEHLLRSQIYETLYQTVNVSQSLAYDFWIASNNEDVTISGASGYDYNSIKKYTGDCHFMNYIEGGVMNMSCSGIRVAASSCFCGTVCRIPSL